MAGVAVAAVGVAISGYSAYTQADTARKAQNQAEENQSKLEAAAKAEDEKAQRDAQIALQRKTHARTQALREVAGRRGRAISILTDGVGRQALGGT